MYTLVSAAQTCTDSVRLTDWCYLSDTSTLHADIDVDDDRKRTCVSLDQPVCDVPPGGFTGSDDLYHLVEFKKNRLA